MKTIVLKYGLIAGGILAFVMVATLPFTREWMQQGYLERVTISSFVVALSAIFFGVRAYHRNSAGKISFGRSLLAGILITAVAGVVNSLTWEVCYQTAFPDFPERFVERQTQLMKDAGRTEAEIELEMVGKREMMETYKTSLPFRLLLSFTELLPMGIVFSLISATVFRVWRK